MITIEVLLSRQGYTSGYEPLAVGKLTVSSLVVTITSRYCVFMFGKSRVGFHFLQHAQFTWCSPTLHSSHCVHPLWTAHMIPIQPAQLTCCSPNLPSSPVAHPTCPAHMLLTHRAELTGCSPLGSSHGALHICRRPWPQTNETRSGDGLVGYEGVKFSFRPR